MRTRKEIILTRVEDLVSDFIYFDRKEDEDLPLNAIEDAVKNNEITKQEIVDTFSKYLGSLK